MGHGQECRPPMVRDARSRALLTMRCSRCATRALNPTRSGGASETKTPVKRGGNRRPAHEEQGRRRGFTGVRPCIFLLIQAKYRGFTGGLHPCGETRHPGLVASAPKTRRRIGCRPTKSPATVSGPGRNSNCGFSPTPPADGCQKTGRQESCLARSATPASSRMAERFPASTGFAASPA